MVWSTLAAFFAGTTAILAKFGVEGMNSHLATAIRTTVVLIFTWTLVMVLPEPVEWNAVSKRAWIFLILSGLTTGLSWICYFRALQLGEVSKVAPIDKLSVLFAMGMAVAILGEVLTWRQWVGGGLIFGGTLLIAWR